MRCAVITPIGPGHHERYAVARASIDHAWQQSRGPFDDLVHLPLPDPLGQFGRSRRRNDGIRMALDQGVDWLFFLDADDFLAPQAFGAVAPYVGRFRAVWGQICEMSPGETVPKLREGQLGPTSDIVDILTHDPYLTIQMGHFVRTEAAADVMFDEGMDTGEDFKYYLGLWSGGSCVKVSDIFFVNLRGHHSTGPRSADGGQWRTEVQKVICEAAIRHDLTVGVTLEGVDARFAVTDPFDLIQQHHCRGVYFEQGVLQSLRDLVGRGKAIVDVGANVGNHVVFYGRHMESGRIHPFEPDPAKAALLARNIGLNGLGDVVDWRGVADPAASLALDRAMGAAAVDFLRIDAGCPTFEVLAGAAALIAANRPLLYVTLPDGTAPRLEDWLRRNDYKRIGEARGPHAVGTLIGPLSAG